MKKTLFILLQSLMVTTIYSQTFYFGADLSYVNEMEDCGATYYEGEEAKDPYAIFADHKANLVRLRLWHTPSWYDGLNEGRRYSDLSDVKKSIRRARDQGMEVLLDFHLSDNWADPGKQIVPKAWEGVVDDLPALSDSLYNYIFNALSELHQDGLLPEMVQVGNETNKGILQTQQQNDSGWKLDWPRNATLFNAAIKAVRDLETETNESIEVMIHIAGPKDAPWFIDNFVANGVTDFDLIGLSYYWQWHSDLDLSGVGETIQAFRTKYPEYEVMIVEIGYPWISDFNDQAGNILGQSHPDYRPFSPKNQADFLIALTEEVLANDGNGVIYWEPAWVSTNCATQWATGSHYENATFFDFQNNLLTEGGIRWMTHNYDPLTSTEGSEKEAGFYTFYDAGNKTLSVEAKNTTKGASIQLFSLQGHLWYQNKIEIGRNDYNLTFLPQGIYILMVLNEKKGWSEKVLVW